LDQALREAQQNILDQDLSMPPARVQFEQGGARMTTTFVRANFAQIASLRELSEITWHFLKAIEKAFGLDEQWHRVPAEGVIPDDQGLGPADTSSAERVAEFLAERGWNDRFLRTPSERTGRSLNDTFFVQFQPEICEALFTGTDEDGQGAYQFAEICGNSN
jgi:hypothetical protein